MEYSEYIERKHHGTYDFPIQYYYVDASHPKYIMDAHWHKEFEIIRVLKGNLKVYLNNIEYSLKKGDTLLVECGVLHRGEPFDCIYECIVFDLNMLIKQKNDITQGYILPIINSFASIKNIIYQNNSKFDKLFITMSKKEAFYELKVYSLLFECFLMLYMDENIIPVEKPANTHQVEVITNLISWMEKNFTEPISLEKLSSITGFSKKYLCRIFKEYTSKTIMNYINELRIESACYEMLKGKNVTDAAFDNGFNDLSYFCRTFKQYKKVTPNQYKKQYQK